MAEYYDNDALLKASELHYDGDISQVTYVRVSDQLGCRWVWTGDTGKCLACGNVDFVYKEDED